MSVFNAVINNPLLRHINGSMQNKKMVPRLQTTRLTTTVTSLQRTGLQTTRTIDEIETGFMKKR